MDEGAPRVGGARYKSRSDCRHRANRHVDPLTVFARIHHCFYLKCNITLPLTPSIDLRNPMKNERTPPAECNRTDILLQSGNARACRCYESL
jgi:hypothetical protein